MAEVYGLLFVMVAGAVMTLVGIFMWQGVWAALAAAGIMVVIIGTVLFLGAFQDAADRR